MIPTKAAGVKMSSTTETLTHLHVSAHLPVRPGHLQFWHAQLRNSSHSSLLPFFDVPVHPYTKSWKSRVSDFWILCCHYLCCVCKMSWSCLHFA